MSLTYIAKCKIRIRKNVLVYIHLCEENENCINFFATRRVSVSTGSQWFNKYETLRDNNANIDATSLAEYFNSTCVNGTF